MEKKLINSDDEFDFKEIDEEEQKRMIDILLSDPFEGELSDPGDYEKEFLELVYKNYIFDSQILIKRYRKYFRCIFLGGNFIRGKSFLSAGNMETVISSLNLLKIKIESEYLKAVSENNKNNSLEK